ncbi:MAG: hypothetical protein EZS28_033628, partial [Streblomastix strix]
IALSGRISNCVFKQNQAGIFNGSVDNFVVGGGLAVFAVGKEEEMNEKQYRQQLKRKQMQKEWKDEDEFIQEYQQHNQKQKELYIDLQDISSNDVPFDFIISGGNFAQNIGSGFAAVGGKVTTQIGGMLFDTNYMIANGVNFGLNIACNDSKVRVESSNTFLLSDIIFFNDEQNVYDEFSINQEYYQSGINGKSKNENNYIEDSNQEYINDEEINFDDYSYNDEPDQYPFFYCADLTCSGFAQFIDNSLRRKKSEIAKNGTQTQISNSSMKDLKQQQTNNNYNQRSQQTTKVTQTSHSSNNNLTCSKFEPEKVTLDLKSIHSWGKDELMKLPQFSFKGDFITAFNPLVFITTNQDRTPYNDTVKQQQEQIRKNMIMNMNMNINEQEDENGTEVTRIYQLQGINQAPNRIEVVLLKLVNDIYLTTFEVQGSIPNALYLYVTADGQQWVDHQFRVSIKNTQWLFYLIVIAAVFVGVFVLVFLLVGCVRGTEACNLWYRRRKYNRLLEQNYQEQIVGQNQSGGLGQGSTEETWLNIQQVQSYQR